MLKQRQSIRLKNYDYSKSGLYFVTICTQNRECLFGNIVGATLGFIVGMFKTECTKQINKLRNTPGQKIFQRNYYERIIRTENDLNKIREYIKLNPLYHV